MSGYISNTVEQQNEMLADIGAKSFEELLVDIPDAVRMKKRFNIPEGLSELELLKDAKRLAEKNANTDDYSIFLGAGAYDHFIPSIVNHLIKRQEFYTAYTPYQPEISQGTLQAIFEYQSMICEITGMDIANASMYDGATAMVEAALLACSYTGKGEILTARSVHPESRDVLRSTLGLDGKKSREIGYIDGMLDLTELRRTISEETAAVIVQNPNFFGTLEDLKKIAEIVHETRTLFIVITDPISLGIIKSPGKEGADIVVGEGQALGTPLSFGGPYLGFFAVNRKLMRKIPGRIVGETVDMDGKRAYVLTIQTREQHIRREKATSNICTNQALNALAAAVYLSTMGREGLKETAGQCVCKANYAYRKLISTGRFKPVFNTHFFKEFVVKADIPIEKINKNLLDDGIIGGYPLINDYPELGNSWLLAVTEKRTKEEIDSFVKKAGEII